MEDDGDGDGDGDRGMRGIYLPVLYPPEVPEIASYLGPYLNSISALSRPATPLRHLPVYPLPAPSLSPPHGLLPPPLLTSRRRPPPGPWQDTFPFPITLWYSPDPGHFTAVLSVRPMHPGDGSGLQPGSSPAALCDGCGL